VGIHFLGTEARLRASNTSEETRRGDSVYSRWITRHLLLAGWLALGGFAWADVVTLKNGRQWEGTIESESAEEVVIRTIGGPMTLSRSDIAEVSRGPTREQEYEQRRTKLSGDDVAGHLALAHWCREQGLASAARFHFQLVLALEADNTEARRALGYEWVDGRWLDHDEAMAARGLVRYQGRWMEPAEAERAQKQDLRRELERRWRGRLGQLLRAILTGTPAARAQATAQFLAIEDPVAGPAVVELLAHRDPRVRRLAVTVVQAQGFRGGDEALAKLVLSSDDAQVRRLARLALVKTGGKRALRLLVQSLSSEKEVVRRRAAVVLGEIGDRRTVPYLIESIRETVVVGNTGAPVVGRLGARDEWILSDFDTVTAPGVAVMVPKFERVSAAVGGGSRGQLEVRTVVSYEAVDALEAITGLEFGDDQEAWRRWWEQEGRSFLRGLRSYR